MSGNSTANDVAKLFIEKTLQQMYPRLRYASLPGWRRLFAPLIPEFLLWNTAPDTRRIVEIGCGDGVFSNMLSLLFPQVEVIGIDTDPDKIAYARTTVSFRQNLKFICGYAGAMDEIPCDRIIYTDCLSRLKNPAIFKKLILKTLPWLVAEGDFLVKESPWRLLCNPAFLNAPQMSLNLLENPARLPQKLLTDIGYDQPFVFESEGIAGFPSAVFCQAYPDSALLETMFHTLLREEQAPEATIEPVPATDMALDVLFPNATSIPQWEFA